MSTALAHQKVVSDLVEEYNQKADVLPESLKAFEQAFPTLEMAASVAGAYVGPAVSGRSSTSIEHLRKNLLASAWKACYSMLNIDVVATARDKKLWDKFLADPAPFTMVNVRERFAEYLINPRTNILRGLAEVFCDLDEAYKSHSKVKIGVKGLPKRLILNYWTGYSGSAKDKLRDIINAIRSYQGRALLTYASLEDVISFNAARSGKVADFDGASRYASGAKVLRDGKLYRMDGYRHLSGDAFVTSTHDRQAWTEIADPEPGIEIRVFGTTQTCHVIFRSATLLDINRALAEFYGEVLPDVEDFDVERRPSTAVSKDLAYYPTPPKVVARVLDAVGIVSQETYSHLYGAGENKRLRVLEPQCGDGRFLDEIRDRGHAVFGVEIDRARAETSKIKGHSVQIGNFLQIIPERSFDVVVMNPPFVGRHWEKHLEHAKRFLKPRGRLACILPATAHYDGHLTEGTWHDLPVASFAESGTNVPTGFVIVRGHAE